MKKKNKVLSEEIITFYESVKNEIQKDITENRLTPFSVIILQKLLEQDYNSYQKLCEDTYEKCIDIFDADKLATYKSLCKISINGVEREINEFIDPTDLLIDLLYFEIYTSKAFKMLESRFDTK